MTLTSKAKGSLAAIFILVASGALYCNTLYTGICPGISAHSVAMALGLESGASQTQVRRVEAQVPDRIARARSGADAQIVTLRTVSAEFRTRHLVWRSLAALVARLKYETLALRLNAMSALFGALAVMLAFALGRGLMLFLNFHDSPVPAENRKAAAMAAGLVTALALGLSAPFWISATRCMPGTFDVFVLLAMGWLLFTAAVLQSPRRLFLFGILWGISLFESETGAYIAAMMFLFAIRAMIVGGIMNVRSWCNCLVGIVAGVFGYLMLAKFVLAGGETSMLLPFKELMSSAKMANSLLFGGGIFEDQAKLGSIFFTILPFAATVALAIWHNIERNAAASGFLIFLLVCTSVISLTTTSISPWGAYKALYPGVMPVTIFVLAAAIVSYLAASGALLAGGRVLTVERRKGRKNDDLSEASVGRLLFWFMLCLSVAAGALNWREVRDYKDDFIAQSAESFTDRLDGHTWLLSTTDALDTMVRISARQRGQRLRIIDHTRSGANISRIRSALSRDEAFKGLPVDVLGNALVSTNLNEFIITWIKNDPAVGKKLILDSPSLWISAGRVPIPAMIGYRAQEEGEKTDWNMLADGHLAFWNEISAADAILGPAAPRNLRAERGEVRAYFCDIGQNLAEQLVKIGSAAKAREILDKVEDLRREPEPAQREELFY